MKLKKLVALFLAALMVLGTLSACGGKTGSDETTKAPAQGTEAPGTEGSGTEAPSQEETKDYSKYEVTEPIEIKFWHNGKANIDFYVDLCNRFNAQSQYVTVVPSCPGNYTNIKDQFTGANQTGDAQYGDLELMPALMAMNFPATPMFYTEGAITDVKELLEAKGFDWSDIVDGLVDQVTVGDAIVAVPWGPSAISYYYNRTVLAKHGLDTYPTTWAEMKEWAPKVYAATGKPALCINADANNMTNLIQSMGGSLQEKDDPTKTDLDNENLKTVLKEMLELHNSGAILFTNEGENIIQTMFINGDVMSFPISCTNYDTLLDGVEASSTATVDPTEWFEIGMAWVFGVDGLGVSTVAGASLVIPERIPQAWKNAAAEFVAWMATPEIQAEWATFSSYIMIHKSNITNPEVTGKVYEVLPEMKNFYAQILDRYEMKPQTQYYDTCMKEFKTTLENIFLNGADFDSTYDYMVEQVEYYLAGN